MKYVMLWILNCFITLVRSMYSSFGHRFHHSVVTIILFCFTYYNMIRSGLSHMRKITSTKTRFISSFLFLWFSLHSLLYHSTPFFKFLFSILFLNTTVESGWVLLTFFFRPISTPKFFLADFHLPLSTLSTKSYHFSALFSRAVIE